MLAWFKEEVFLIPNWAWFAIILGIACLLIAIIIIACVTKGDKGKDNAAEPILMENDSVKAEDEKQAVEPVLVAPEEKKEEPAAEKVEEKPVEEKPEPKKEKKPAAKKEAKAVTEKTEVKKDEKPVAKKEEKPAAKKEEKPAAKKEEKPADKKEEKPEPKKEEPAEDKKESASDMKVYHISKRKEDKKWQVKAEGADKALRLFFTQNEAIDYAKKVAAKQEGRIVIHKEGGGFRKLNY